MGHLRGLFLIGATLAVVAVASTVVAQQPGAQISIDAVDSTRYPVVDITVTVRDRSGMPVSDVPSSAFVLHAGARILPVTRVADAASDEGRLSVVLAFDASGSMSGAPLETAKGAGKALISQLRPNDMVAVLAFGSSVSTIQPFTSDPILLAAAIDSLTAAGDTALYEGVTQSLLLAESAESPRRAIVLLSDGTDHGGISTTSRDASLTAAGSGALPVFTVGLGEFIDEAYLGELSATSGGTISLAESPDSLTGLYESIGAVLGRQHVVSFDASSIEASAVLRLEIDYAGSQLTAEARFEPPLLPEAVADPVEDAGPGTSDEPEVTEPVLDRAADPLGDSPIADAPGGTGASMPVLAIAVASPAVLVSLSIGALAYIVRRRRRSERSGDLPEEILVGLLRRPEVEPTGAPTTSTDSAEALTYRAPGQSTVAALLKVTSGGNEISYPVDGAPITIGFSPDCSIVLPHTNGEHYERIRVWQREGRFMLHNLSRSGRVTVGGKQVSWLILEDGDLIDIGSCRVLFQSA